MSAADEKMTEGMRGEMKDAVVSGNERGNGTTEIKEIERGNIERKITEKKNTERRITGRRNTGRRNTGRGKEKESIGKSFSFNVYFTLLLRVDIKVQIVSDCP